jgi:hypothetical protein
MAACGAASPRPAATDWRDAATDGGCADRERVRPICLRAVQTRCESERGDCEAACEPRLGPGSSEKAPALRGDIEGDNCREGCRVRMSTCRAALEIRCPAVCAEEAGPPLRPDDWPAPAGE